MNNYERIKEIINKDVSDYFLVDCKNNCPIYSSCGGCDDYWGCIIKFLQQEAQCN